MTLVTLWEFLFRAGRGNGQVCAKLHTMIVIAAERRVSYLCKIVPQVESSNNKRAIITQHLRILTPQAERKKFV